MYSISNQYSDVNHASYNPQYDTYSPSYNPGTLSTRAKHLAFCDVYAGTDSDYTKNKLCASNVLVDGPMTCVTTATYITFRVTRQMNDDFSQHFNLSELRIYSEFEIGSLITDFSAFNTLIDPARDPAPTLGLTPEASFDHLNQEVRVSAYNFELLLLSETQIRAVTIHSLYGKGIKVTIEKAGTSVGVCVPELEAAYYYSIA